MCVYLLHFETKLANHAQHYMGFSDCLQARIAAHEHGNGAKLMAAIARNDIKWVVARVWLDGDRTLERRLKMRKNGPALCPICTGAVLPGYSVDVRKITFQKGPPALGEHQGKRRPMGNHNLWLF
jgi:predicted GIY-YIG superfamily endonuclease